MNQLKSIINIGLLLVTCQLHAFDFDYRFHNITIDDGLPQNSVLCIHEDSYGFIWFGTFDGVCRLNGKNIKVFIPEDNNPFTINDGSVYQITEDFEGNIYIATNSGGLNIYNPQTEKFTYLQNDSTENSIIAEGLYDIFYAKDSSLWIGGYNGLCRYFPEHKKFISYNETDSVFNAFFGYTVNCINQDLNENIWIGTYGGGLFRFNPDSNTFTQYKNNLNPLNEYNSNLIKKIEIHKDTDLLLATDDGTYTFNLIQHTYQKFHPEIEEVISVLCDQQKNVWLTTVEEGLYKITAKGKKINLTHDVANKYSIPDNRVNEIFQDKQGSYWVGTGSQGLAYFRSNAYRFYHYYKKELGNSLIGNDVFGIEEGPEKKVWIATVNGVSIFNPLTRKFLNWTSDGSNKTINNNQVYDIYYDSTGYMWFAYNTGIGKYNLNSKTFDHFEYIRGDTSSLPNNENFCFEADKNGDIWIGSFQGLAKYNRNKNNFTRYFSWRNRENVLTNDVIWSIFSDSKGQLWVGTSKGLNKYNFEKDHFTSFDPKHPELGILAKVEINFITEDSEGSLWLSTTKGLIKADLANNKISHFTINDGLPNQMIYGIVEHNENIWFTSNLGLSRMNKYTFEIANFDVNDGLQSNEFNIATAKLSNNIIMFGGINGITAFDPDDIKKSEQAPKVFFTKLSLNGFEVKPNEKRNRYIPLKKSIIEAKQLNLSHKEKLIQIEFNALEYFVSHKVKYQYRFLPNSKDWIDLGNANTVTFTNLNPGKYKLEIRSTNGDQVWTNNNKSLKITIHPPFFQRKWVMVVEALFAILLILLFIRNRIQKVKRSNFRLEHTVIERTEEINAQKEELKVQRDQIIEQKNKIEKSAQELELKIQKRTKELKKSKEKAEESDRLKSAFLANMSHEIRTPMNAIIGFSELINSPDISDKDRKEYTELIRNNGESLLNLLNDILDISIIESGKIHIVKKKFSVAQLIYEVYESFLQNKILKEKPLVSLELIEAKNKNIYLESDPYRIKQILNNLISNALKYTSKGKVSIEYVVGSKQVVFKISDTGIGIYPQDLQRIFNRFHKNNDNDTNPYRGGGLGLAISKNLVELLGGEIWVESEPDVGSVFYFSIGL